MLPAYNNATSSESLLLSAVRWCTNVLLHRFQTDLLGTMLVLKGSTTEPHLSKIHLEIKSSTE